MEHVLRSCVLGLSLAEDVGLDESERAVVYYVTLVAWLGCHADSYEQVAWFGDDIALSAEAQMVDSAGPELAAFVLRRVGRGRPPWRRALWVGSLLLPGSEGIPPMQSTHCLIAGLFALRLGLGPEVRDPLQQVFERWDGKGAPARLAGQQISIAARIVVIADIVEAFRRVGGVEAAVDIARRRAGGQFDPGLAEHVCANADALLGGLEDAESWDVTIGAEPALAGRLTDLQLDSAPAAVADFSDFKSPYTTGHPRGGAERAAAAARLLGLGNAEADELRRAGLLHDVGRIGVPNTIWDKPGPLTQTEMERVRMHPYLTQRTFSRSPRLAQVAAEHHERLDGPATRARSRAARCHPRRACSRPPTAIRR